MSNSTFRKLAPSMLLTTAMFAGNSFAQMEEVIVTAQKRAEDLQDVPIAVTAMNEQMLKEAGISNVSGVAVRTPGFSMGEFNPTQPQLYIRGIGSNGDGAASGEQSVAMFIDGVYVNRSAGTGMELFDISSIEVLRGPQGTLWGKNSVAGAINVTTRRPTLEFESALELTAGNLGYTNARGFVSGGITDKIAGKLSLNSKHRDSYVKSVYNPEVEHGEMDSMGARMQLEFQPIDTLTALLTLNYSEDDRTGTAAVPGEDAGSLATMLQRAQDDGFVRKAGFHENYSDTEGFTSMENQGASLKLDWDIGDVTLTSITSHTSNYADMYSDGFNVAAEIWAQYGFLEAAPGVEVPLGRFEVYAFIDEESDLFTQEFRLAGYSEKLKWQAGLYYAKEDTQRIEGQYFDAPLLATFVLGPQGALYSPSIDQALQDNTTTSYAAFGEATYSLTEKLELTFGARFTQETKQYRNEGTMTSVSPVTGLPIVGDPLTPPLEVIYDVEETWKAPTFRAVANYFVGEESMVYASAATGFKSGGFAPSTPQGSTQDEPFNEEKALNLEIGMKTTMLDQTLRINTAIFRTDYEDLQVLQQFECSSCIIPPLITKNAGRAISQGVELEATYLFTDNLVFTGSYAYLDTEYVELGGQLKEDEGNKLRNAPRNAYTAALSYHLPLGDKGFLDSRVEYVYKDQAYQDTANIDFAAIPEYSLVNGRLAYTSPAENWEVSLWGKNLLDEEYYLHNFQLPPFGAIHVPATPRTFGLTVTYTSF
ncbi:TonB-dependent receptor [Spongiibacter sp. KMU-158]|uniref:TonB-dependent receptor n=1 Tax=Spongiibacter pelagi TaxID=2760804 RepID=A0A927GW12_9GAMM|nr:TonB-dependent receptor [Spongiibacter pelagi]MBD2857944.1 TonB-dependent receptor [Spongiibacter pelagi]